MVEFQAGDAAPAPEEACSPYYFNPVPGHYTTLIGELIYLVLKTTARWRYMQVIAARWRGRFSLNALECPRLDKQMSFIDMSIPHYCFKTSMLISLD